MSAAYVRLRHKKTGATWECPARAVDHWLPLGWQRDEEKKPSARRRGDTTEEESNGN